MRIVVTHGRGQAFEIPTTMQREWGEALRFGLASAGLSAGSSPEIEFAFYGDIWRPDRRAARDDDERGEPGSASVGDDERGVATALDEPPSDLQAGIANEILPPGDDEERLDWDRLAAIVRRIDEVFGVGEILLTHFMKDLDEYFGRPDIREQAIAAVRDVCRRSPEPILLMGHSMGSIVAYDLLATDGASPLAVEGLVTFGSPLGMASLRRHVERIHPGTPFPDGLPRWVNVYNDKDFATVIRELAPLYRARDGRAIEDVEAVGRDPSLLDPGRAHDPIVYLSSLGLAQPVRELLEPAMEARMEDALPPMMDAPGSPPAARRRVTRGLREIDDGDRGGAATTASSAPPLAAPAASADVGDAISRDSLSAPAAEAPTGEAAGPTGTRTVERTASADFPPVVEPGSTHDLVVAVSGIAVHARSAELDPWVVPVDQKTLTLRVGAYAADFDVHAADDPRRTWVDVTVDLHDPGAIADGRFKLTAHKLGDRRETPIYLTFYRGNLPVGQLTLITVIDPVHEVRRAPIAVTIGGAPDPDYVLVITDRSAGLKGAGPFDIYVSKEGEFLNKPLGTFPVAVDAWDYASLRLEGFRRVKDEPTVEDRIRAAETLGLALWNDLPEQFQRFYWEELHGREGASVAIYSQEPYIPWELIKPQREVGGPEDGFLGATLRMARWKQAVRFPDPVTVSGFSVIAPIYGPESGSRPLPGAQLEADELVRDFGAAKIPGDRATVRGLLESTEGVQLIHFAGHGDFDPKAPETSIIRLADARLAPQDLARATLGRASHPFVFLNACEVGEQGWALTRIGGWAEAFTDIGFSGFIGPYWAVNDRVARKAAGIFYRSLAAGLTVAEGVRQIRLQFYTDREDAGHPSWLAYTLHCQPNIRIGMPRSAIEPGGTPVPSRGAER
jgi:CHAT domain/PGAP1-like protein